MSNKKITDLPPTATVDFADVLEIVQGGISKSIAVGILAPATKIGPGATPTALVGLVAIPGSSLFPIRSDGAPALNQAIAPTWSATHTFSLTPVVPNSSWTYAKIQNVSATSRILGRITAGAGVIEELTGTQATTLLDVFTSGLKGLVPLSGGGTTTFLRADGTFANNGANPTASLGLAAINGSASTFMRSDGAPALDVTIAPTWSATHTFSLTPVVPNSSWTYAKIQNVSATSRVLGRITAGAGVIEELTGANLATIIGTSLGANPSASVGLTAVNGSAGTYMRSDAAPQLDVSITPTWTGTHAFTKNTNASSPLQLTNTDVGTTAQCFYQLSNGTSSAFYGLTGTGYSGTSWTSGPTGQQVFLGTSANIPLSIGTSSTERIRVTGGGLVAFPSTTASNFMVGTTVGAAGGYLGQFLGGASLTALLAHSTTSTSSTFHIWNADTTGNNIIAQFFTDAALQRGSITFNRAGTLIVYNTTSDARLKKNIVPAPSASALIDQLQVRSFDWKETGAHMSHWFVAQELNEVVPIAVTTGDTGEEISKVWSIDPGKLVPLLVKELQDLRARVAALEATA